MPKQKIKQNIDNNFIDKNTVDNDDLNEETRQIIIINYNDEILDTIDEWINMHFIKKPSKKNGRYVLTLEEQKKLDEIINKWIKNKYKILIEYIKVEKIMNKEHERIMQDLHSNTGRASHRLANLRHNQRRSHYQSVRNL